MKMSLSRVVLAPLLVVLGGCLPDAVLVQRVEIDRELTETVVERADWLVSDRVVIVDITGMILDVPEPKLLSEGENPVSLLREQLKKAAQDDRVKGIVLRINSPGGTVTASELMYDELRRFKQGTNKPVVAVMLDVAASGGYYVACACDEIIAQRSTVTGSIGVIMQLFDLTGTMQKLGITGHAIKSGPQKAAGSPFEPLEPEERAVFQGLVDTFYDQFVKVVAEGRDGLDEAAVRELADGRVYSAPQAVELGLVDRIGTIYEAIAAIKGRAGIEKCHVVRYRRPLEYVGSVYARAAAQPGRDIALFKIDWPSVRSLGTPQFLYLWAPAGD